MEQYYSELGLMASAAMLGAFHTLIGPDHYLPFVALAKCRKWGISKTMLTTFICGLGHTMSSIVIGCVGIFIGMGVGAVERSAEVLQSIDGSRADIVKWLFLGFALAYMIYGVKRGLSNSAHMHRHFDGTVHCHGTDGEVSGCGCGGEDAPLVQHSHFAPMSNSANFWVLFILFVLGPCEILIPLVMYPASRGDWFGVLGISFAFSFATIFTMMALVFALMKGMSKINIKTKFFEKWNCAITGFVFFCCALLMFIGL